MREKGKVLYLIPVIIFFSCSSAPEKPQSSNSNSYQRYAPSYNVSYLEAPEELNLFKGEKRERTKNGKETAIMVPLAKVILSDMGTSILFSYMKQFDEINYIHTQNIVPLVDLWFEVEQDFLLKMYSNNVIMANGSWDLVSKKITQEEWSDILANRDTTENWLWSEFRPAWALFYPILADPLGRTELNKRGYTKAFEGTFSMDEFYRRHYQRSLEIWEETLEEIKKLSTIEKEAEE